MMEREGEITITEKSLNLLLLSTIPRAFSTQIISSCVTGTAGGSHCIFQRLLCPYNDVQKSLLKRDPQGSKMDRVSRSPNPLSFHLIVPMYVVVCTRYIQASRSARVARSSAPRLARSPSEQWKQSN